MAFFYTVIKKIEESETFHLHHDLLHLLPKWGLRLPDHVSSLLRFVRQNTDKARNILKKAVALKRGATSVTPMPSPVLKSSRQE